MSQIKFMSTNKNSEIDFNSLPELGKSNDFQEFVNQKKQELEEKINYNPRRSTSSAWILVFLLMLTLVGLGTFTLTQLRQNNQEISNLKQKNAVAGSTDENSYNYPPISGYAFTILPGEAVPAGYNLTRKTEQSTIFKDRTAVFSSYINESLNSGRKIKSGIEVEVLEYDNKYNQQQFSDLIATTLGNNFKLVSNDIIIPRNFKISRIDSQDKNIGYNYYVAVTNDNYYIIKIFNQSIGISDLKDVNRFTDNILGWLYLN